MGGWGKWGGEGGGGREIPKMTLAGFLTAYKFKAHNILINTKLKSSQRNTHIKIYIYIYIQQTQNTRGCIRYLWLLSKWDLRFRTITINRTVTINTFYIQLFSNLHILTALYPSHSPDIIKSTLSYKNVNEKDNVQESNAQENTYSWIYAYSLHFTQTILPTL